MGVQYLKEISPRTLDSGNRTGNPIAGGRELPRQGCRHRPCFALHKPDASLLEVASDGVTVSGIALRLGWRSVLATYWDTRSIVKNPSPETSLDLIVDVVG